MARKIKCKHCGIADSHKEEMKVEYYGANNTPRYFHNECYDLYLEEKALKDVVTCQRCKIKSPRREMGMDYVGAEQIGKYYHKDCLVEYLKEKEFKEHERVEIDKLVEVIKKIYGVKAIPNNAYPYLQDLRNGTKFFGKYDYKYKEGYSYDLIAETFEYCSETIEYWNAKKTFNGFTNALRYALVIVCDKISIVEERRKQREKQRLIIEKQIENISQEDDFENNYKKPSKRVDITDFLDD